MKKTGSFTEKRITASNKKDSDELFANSIINKYYRAIKYAQLYGSSSFIFDCIECMSGYYQQCLVYHQFLFGDIAYRRI